MDKGRGSAPDYAIWMDAAEEQALREALHVAQAAQAEVDQQRGGGGRLLRDARKLHQVYGQLARLGFGKEDIEQCLPHMRSDSSLNDALDWACLHLPEASLPPSFRMATPDAEDGDKELDKSSLLKKIASAPAVAKPEGRFLEAKKRAAAFAKKAAGGGASAKRGGAAGAADEVVAAAAAAAEAEVERAASEWRGRHSAALAADSEEEHDEDEEVALLTRIPLPCCAPKHCVCPAPGPGRSAGRVGPRGAGRGGSEPHARREGARLCEMRSRYSEMQRRSSREGQESYGASIGHAQAGCACTPDPCATGSCCPKAPGRVPQETARLTFAAEADARLSAGELRPAARAARASRRSARQADTVEAALVRLVPKFETRVAKRRSAAEAEAKRAVRRKSWRVRQWVCAHPPPLPPVER